MTEKTPKLDKDPEIELRPLTSDNLAECVEFIRSNKEHFSDFSSVSPEGYRDILLNARIMSVWGIYSNKTLVGIINLKPVPSEPATKEVGYLVGESWRGRGVAPIAVKKLIQSATNYRSFISITNSRDSASKKVLEKSGFILERYTNEGNTLFRYNRRLN